LSKSISGQIQDGGLHSDWKCLEHTIIQWEIGGKQDHLLISGCGVPAP